MKGAHPTLAGWAIRYWCGNPWSIPEVSLAGSLPDGELSCGIWCVGGYTSVTHTRELGNIGVIAPGILCPAYWWPLS